MPRLPTNLVRLGAVYKYRARIPQDLLAHYAPKREVMVSLHTKSLIEARRLLPAAQQTYQDEWHQVRQLLILQRACNSEEGMSITDDSIQYVCSFFEHVSLTGDELTRSRGHYTLDEVQEWRAQLTEAIPALSDAAAIGDIDSIRPALDLFLHLYKIPLTGSEADYRKLALAYLRTALKTDKLLLARMQGENVSSPEIQYPPSHAATAKHASPAKRSGQIKLPLYSLFEYWRDLVKHRSARTVDDIERHINAFDQLTGHKSADTLTKADFIAYRDQRLAAGKAPKTVGKDLSFLKAVMQQACDADKIPSNPAAGIKIPQAKGGTRLKRMLTTGDLTILLGSPIYSEGKRLQGGGGEAAAWLPLLALYTGARLEELCQLTVDDVQQEEGIPFLHITLILDDDEAPLTSLKTDSSLRRVPLHQKHLDAGFLEYVAYIREQNHTWLFPLLTPDTYGKRGGNFTKWWGLWRGKLGIGGRHRCFHAFRDTFKTACRGALIGEDLHDALTGHAGGGVGRDYGSFPLNALNDAMQKVRYPGLVFDWKWTPPKRAQRASRPRQSTKRATSPKKGSRSTERQP
jgi:integrase